MEKPPKKWWQVWRTKNVDATEEIQQQVEAVKIAEQIANKKADLNSIKINQTLTGMATQLDKVDEQNKLLIMTLDTLKENNQVLLQQIQTLSDTNKQLFARLVASRKREKVIKIIATLSTIIAFGLGVYQLIKILLPLL